MGDEAFELKAEELDFEVEKAPPKKKPTVGGNLSVLDMSQVINILVLERYRTSQMQKNLGVGWGWRREALFKVLV